MKRIEALKDVTTDELYERRRELHQLYMDDRVPQHVKQGAASLLNYYGTEIDARMVNAEYGMGGSE